MRLNKNSGHLGRLATLTQICQESNLCEATVRRVAAQSGAVRKIGKSYRIAPDIFFQFIDSEYSVN